MTVCYVEHLLQEGLGLQDSFELRVERAHRALTLKPPSEAPPRSFVAKMSSFRMKEEILRLAWQKRGFQLHGKRIYLDHDYTPDVLKKCREYTEAKSVLKEKRIRFQTLFPAKLSLFYPEGTVLYRSAEEATGDMAKRGLPVSVIKHPESLLGQIQRFKWRRSRRPGNWERAGKVGGYKERLLAFRRQDPQ